CRAQGRAAVGFVPFHSTLVSSGTKTAPWNGTERNGMERNGTKGDCASEKWTSFETLTPDGGCANRFCWSACQPAPRADTPRLGARILDPSAPSRPPRSRERARPPAGRNGTAEGRVRPGGRLDRPVRGA